MSLKISAPLWSLKQDARRKPRPLRHLRDHPIETDAGSAPLYVNVRTLLPFASEPSSQHLKPPLMQAILIDVSLSYLYRHDSRSCELFDCGFDVHDDIPCGPPALA